VYSVVATLHEHEIRILVVPLPILSPLFFPGIDLLFSFHHCDTNQLYISHSKALFLLLVLLRYPILLIKGSSRQGDPARLSRRLTSQHCDEVERVHVVLMENVSH
jgi:hypothetical protein